MSPTISEEEKAENGEGYLTSWCAGGRGNTTHTPEARRSNYNFRTPLEKFLLINLFEVPIARFYFSFYVCSLK